MFVAVDGAVLLASCPSRKTILVPKEYVLVLSIKLKSVSTVSFQPAAIVLVPLTAVENAE